jgi:hypothetical protein
MTYSRAFNFSLLFIVALSQIFSPVLYVPGGEALGLSVFRSIIFIIAFFVYINYGLSNNSNFEKTFFACSMIIFIWMTLSLFWSENLISGIKHIAYLSSIVATSYIICHLTKDETRFRDFGLIISLIGLVIVFISFYEINTGIHFFRSSLQDESELSSSLNYISENQAWFTFGNPNDLTVHIAFCCLATISFSRSIAYRVLYISVSIYLSYVLDSRIVVISLLAFTVLYIILENLIPKKLFTDLPMIILVSGGIALLVIVSQAGRFEFIDTSSFVRLQLIASAIDMSQRTLLIGIGTGGFETEMWQGGYVGRTIGITNPHNAFGRIIAENGLLGLALFSYMLLLPLFAMRQGGVRSKRYGAAIASSMVVMPLLFSVGSDPLSSSSLQLAVAFMIAGTKFAVGAAPPISVTRDGLKPTTA